jgi:transposase InsO family protein
MPHPYTKKLKLIAYDSINTYIIKKFKLPQTSELIEIARVNFKIEKENNKAKASIIINRILEFEYAQWESLRNVYLKEFLDEEKLEMYCKTHVLLSKIIELNEIENGFKLKDLFNAYCCFDGLVFQTDNYTSFCNKIRKIRKCKSLEDELLHGLRKQISNNFKMSEDIIIEIIRHMGNPKIYNAGHITEFLNDYLIRQNRKPISISSVERVMALSYVKNETMLSRYGNKYANENLLPHAHFILPHKEGILWMMDGTRFQFPYKGGAKKFNYLTFFIVLDGYSKKIMGYSYDDSENSTMVIEAFEKAARNTQYLPTEIVTDNSTAYRSKEFIRIIATAKSMGVNWRTNKTNNPRDSHYVERCFGVIQEKYCKKHDGYLGDGIKSRNRNGRISPEETAKNLKNKNLRTRDELVKLIETIINEYNESRHREALIKKDEYELQLQEKRKIDSIPLNPINYATLFWSSRELIVNMGMVSFTMNKETYNFNIYDEEIIRNYHGNKVKVRYNESDLTKVMLFELNSDKYICTLNQSPNIPKAGAERSGIENQMLREHSSKKKELIKRIKERNKQVEEQSRKNWENVPPELSQFSAISKPLSEESENNLMDDELSKLQELEKFKSLNMSKRKVSINDIFDDIFSEKGNLKPLNYGRN